MTTLESLLKARVAGDARAHVGVVEIVGGSTRILFGALGDIGRVILSVSGNTVSLVHPPLEGDAARDFALESIEGEQPAQAAADARSDADISRDVHLSAFEQVTITPLDPPDLNAGEFVASNQPLQPGESPEDGAERQASDDPDAPRPGDGAGDPNTSLIEQISEGTGVELPDANNALSEVKNPDGSTREPDEAAAAAQGGDNGDAGGNASTETATPAPAPAASTEAAPATVPTPEPAKPVDHKDFNKAELIALGRKTPGAEFADDDTKAAIAAAINKANGL